MPNTDFSVSPIRLAWFKIAYGFNSQVGWIAEGTNYYFVEPIVR